MPKLPTDQQTALLEAHVGKIDKAMQMLVRDGKKLSDVLDVEAQKKLAVYLHARVNDMIADLGKAKRAVFSLDAPLENPCKELLQLPGVAVAIPADQIIHGSLSAVQTTVLPPTPSVPQPQADEDEELAAIAELDEAELPTPPRQVPVTYDVAPPPPPDPTVPPKNWRKPTGRLVGTKQPVWVETEPPHGAGDAPTEKPDSTGHIKDAGFLEAE